MGFFNIFKKSKRQQIRDNADQGREGEAQVRSKYEMNGYDVKRTGPGADYRVTKRNWLTGKKVTKYVEVKTGNAKLSPLQKKKRKQYGGSYKVERVDTNPFAVLLGSSSQKKTRTKKTRKRKSSSRSTTSVHDTIFGSPKKRSSGRKSSSSNSWGFGSDAGSFW